MSDSYFPAFLDVWAKELEEGRIWLPDTVGDWSGHAAASMVRRLRSRVKAGVVGAVSDIEVYVATGSGLPEHWDLVAELEHATRDGLTVTCRACYRAISGGLNLLIAGSRKTAHVDTKFGFHGDGSPRLAAAAKDRMRCEYYARHTNPDFDWWWEKSKTGEVWYFGVEEALDVGVIDEIMYGPVPWSHPMIYA